MQLAIYGAGSLGKQLYDVALRVNEQDRRWTDIFFIDDVRQERQFYLSRVHRLTEVQQMDEPVEALVANGTPKNRKKMAVILREAGISLTNLIDPSVIISPSAMFTGGGISILPYSRVSSDAVVGENTLIQPYVYIPHDVHVGANSVFSANVALGGKLQIGEECYFGLGSVVRENLTIGARAIIGMGAVVLHDVDCDSVMVGNPAHVLRKSATGEVFHT